MGWRSRSVFAGDFLLRMAGVDGRIPCGKYEQYSISGQFGDTKDAGWGNYKTPAGNGQAGKTKRGFLPAGTGLPKTERRGNGNCSEYHHHGKCNAKTLRNGRGKTHF